MTSVVPAASRSAGCHACRRMKVKCDEEKPSCMRCERGGRQCPGYRAPGDIIFRSMNLSAENRSLKQKRRPNKAIKATTLLSSSRSDSSDRQSGNSDSDLVVAYRNSEHSTKTLAPPLPTDWHQQAICQFFYDYVVPINDKGQGGYLTFLPDLYQRNQRAPFLVEALDAVSMASLASRNSMPHLMMRARRSYGKALTLVNMALNLEQHNTSDELQASLMLLTKYEVITGDKDSLMGSHAAGQVQIVRLRGKDQFKTSTGCEIYLLIRSRQTLADLAYQCPPSMGVEAPLDDMKPHRARVSSWLSRINALYGALAQKMRGAPGRIFPKGWDTEVLALEEEIWQWEETVPDFWRYWSLPPYDAIGEPDLEDGPIYPKAIYVCSGLLQTFGWTLIWCGRIHLLHAMLVYRSTLTDSEALESPLPSVSRINQELLKMVDNICNMAPFMLGEVNEKGALNAPGRGKAIGAVFLMWTLHVAGSVSITPQSQQDWIAGRLLHIGHSVGIRQALVLKDFRDFQRRTSPGMPLSRTVLNAMQGQHDSHTHSGLPYSPSR